MKKRWGIEWKVWREVRERKERKDKGKEKEGKRREGNEREGGNVIVISRI